jgi:hypothetical protein
MAQCTRPKAKNDYCVVDGLCFMAIGQGIWPVLDLADLQLVANYTWGIASAEHPYVRTTIRDDDGRQRNVYMHRVIMGVTEREQHVDHLDGNVLNNSRSNNLRVVSRRQNLVNRVKVGSKWGYRGVMKHAAGKTFGATLMHDGDVFTLTKIPTAIEAGHEYDKLAVQHRGLDGLQPRSLNFPETYEFLMKEIHGVDVSGSYGLKAA